MPANQNTTQNTTQNKDTTAGSATKKDPSTGATAASGSSQQQTGQEQDREKQVPIGTDRGDTRSSADRSDRVSSQPSNQYGVSSQAYATPFSFMRRFTEEMDRLFEDFAFGPTVMDPLFSIGSGYAPTARSIGGGRQQNLGTGVRAGTAMARPEGAQGLTQRGALFPQIELLQRGDNLVIRADLPGIKREDVHVDCEDGALTLSGTRKDESTEQGDGFFHTERTYGAFTRVIPLPKDVDPSSCKAKFENGVLEVTIPVPKEKSRAKRIEIQ